MKRKLLTPGQIVATRSVQQTEGGTTSILEVCRQRGITEVTFYHWDGRYQGMTISESKVFERLANTPGGGAGVCWPGAIWTPMADALKVALAHMP